VPSISQEGDTTIIPVVEEVVVVERRLVFKEEGPHSTREHKGAAIKRPLCYAKQEALITREEADRHSNTIPPTLPSFEQHPNRKGEK